MKNFIKTKSLALLLLASLPLRVALAEDIPKPYAFARYQAMLDRSPFAVATAVAAPAATPNFAKDLYVANAMHSKEGDLVTIASNADKNFKKYLTTNAPEDGYSITNIEWSEKVGATKVTIAKEGQTATLSFNEALLRQPLASGQNQQQVQQQQVQQPQALQPQPIVPQPNLPMTQPNVQKPAPMPVPMLPTPPPRVRGVIPRNPTERSSAPNPNAAPMQTPVPAEPEL
jgi:hypothetical protein